VACLVIPYFSILSHKRHDLRKNILNVNCVFWYLLQLLSEIFLILRKIQGDIIINVHRYSCEVPVFSCQIWMKLEIKYMLCLVDTYWFFICVLLSNDDSFHLFFLHAVWKLWYLKPGNSYIYVGLSAVLQIYMTCFRESGARGVKSYSEVFCAYRDFTIWNF
jgi:hypothetical protein